MFSILLLISVAVSVLGDLINSIAMVMSEAISVGVIKQNSKMTKTMLN
jgi:hypothetical protein